MKKSILITIGTVIIYFVYAIYFYLEELGRSFGSLSYSSEEIIADWTMLELFVPFSILFFIIVIASSIFIHTNKPKNHRLYALMPLIYLCMGMVFFL